MDSVQQVISDCIGQSKDRNGFWTLFLSCMNVSHMAEIGVFSGQFAAQILKQCPSVETYYMVDPWRHLGDWNKPSNKSDHAFQRLFSEAMSCTDFAADKRIVLRGKTTEVVDDIPNGKLDFAYLDGDHTLRGITIDLIRLYPKLKPGGWMGGDDFNSSVFQHSTDYEPTLVFPFVVFFAEAVGARLYALPYSQFLMEKGQNAFSFVDLTGRYGQANLQQMFGFSKVLKRKLLDFIPSRLLGR